MTFDSAVERAVQGFIKSVVVVDDRASLEVPSLPPANVAVVVPFKRGMVTSEAEPRPVEGSGHPANPPDAKDGGFLNGLELTRQFATLGMACSIYKPTEVADTGRDIENTARVARHADVVVLDWHIGAGSDVAAREILKRIVSEDRKEHGRLRLVVIYTSEPNLVPIQSLVQADLASVGENTDPDNGAARPTLRSAALGVVFITKATGSAPLATGVSETDLPGELVKAFARLSRGVVPTVAIAAITAVRNSTHHVLARFHADLDPALATHRSLLTHPEDAESFVAELVADELKAVIEASHVGSRHSNIGVWRGWLKSLPWGGGEFKETATSTKGLGQEGAVELLEKGKAAHDKVGKLCNPVVGSNRFPKVASNFFSPDLQTARRANLELSRLSVFEREAYSNSWLPSDWEPTLTLGTVVALDQAIYVCIQPACDAVRIEARRRFPLVPLKADSDKFSLVVRTAGGADECFEPDYHLYKLEQVEFDPDPTKRMVLATRKDEGYCFGAADGKQYLWLADMRQPMAARFAQQWAVQADRMGLDDYEWLRAKAN